MGQHPSLMPAHGVAGILYMLLLCFEALTPDQGRVCNVSFLKMICHVWQCIVMSGNAFQNEGASFLGKQCTCCERQLFLPYTCTDRKQIGIPVHSVKCM